MTGPARKVVAIGEAMIEMAPVGEGLFRRSFAGDTYNTAWHMAQTQGAGLSVAFCTAIGTDRVSGAFLAELAADRIETGAVRRIADRTMGLYMIELDGVERSFQYWRGQSAARCIADDPAALARAVDGAALVHLSGITLAILDPAAREALRDALAMARRGGARVSFDPNVRPRLWSSPDAAREAIAAVLHVTDIALPSFDDESGLWGDGMPADTARRLHAAGVGEVVVKNGGGPATVSGRNAVADLPTPPVDGIRDTTGAGDAFNAGYLAARLNDASPNDAVARGQAYAAEVIRHFGARMPKDRVPGV